VTFKDKIAKHTVLTREIRANAVSAQSSHRADNNNNNNNNNIKKIDPSTATASKYKTTH